MPYSKMPTFKSTPDKMLEVPQPAIGGLNLNDLEFEQEVSQSPYMKNIMYRNGAFSKRYGQEVHSTYSDTVYATTFFGGSIFVHSGTKIYRYADAPVEVGDDIPESSGLFIVFMQKLYYMTSDGFLVYENDSFDEITPYIPDILINCSPDGESSGGDVVDDYNVIGNQFNIIYNGTEDTTEYIVGPYDPDENINWSVRPSIKVNETNVSDFTVDATNKKIVFGTAPGEGDMNVVMTFTLADGKMADEKQETLSCKFYDTYGGQYNSRVFLGGDGQSRYYWSASFDITYWPALNFARLGNTEDDIMGFGRQYNVLIAFKPRETHQIVSYTENQSSTIVEEAIGTEYFRASLVNPRIGCDSPHSIQVINNLLTWFNSSVGVCTLVSTNIQDERNIRVLSRNVEYTNNFGIGGLLDTTENLNLIISADFDKKYFLVFPTTGRCFIWDYEISPYFYSSANGETPPSRLSWFYFDNFYAKNFVVARKELFFISSHANFQNELIKLNHSLYDLDYNDDGESDAIEAFYLTPFMQFGSVEMLKNIRNLYVQCKGDTRSKINIYYYTNDATQPEPDPEPVEVSGGRVLSLWDNFAWDTFMWFVNVWGNTFRRKCNIKKVQMCAVFFENSEAGKDLSVTHIGFQYQYVKYVR